MRSDLIGADVTTRKKEIFHEDHAAGELVYESRQDIEPILKQNKEERKEDSGSWKGDFHKVATIPNVVVEELMHAGIWDDPDALKAWLNDPEQEVFRTKKGRI